VVTASASSRVPKPKWIATWPPESLAAIPRASARGATQGLTRCSLSNRNKPALMKIGATCTSLRQKTSK
jgi:hypothetical protein